MRQHALWLMFAYGALTGVASCSALALALDGHVWRAVLAAAVAVSFVLSAWDRVTTIERFVKRQ